MDLLTRGAGFGYIGSTITSLIYASFTFIFFAPRGGHHGLRAGTGASTSAGLGLPASALVVIPLVTHGVTTISRLQAGRSRCGWLMLVLPFAFWCSWAPRTRWRDLARYTAARRTTAPSGFRCSARR